MKRHLRNCMTALILILTVAPALAGCVVAAGPGWHHGYWYRGHWYR
ncbi:MAG: hypothetical protein ACXWLT_02380 [Rhizomicrobium sp.]